MRGRLWQDIRFGFRMLFKQRMLSAVAVLTFGVGIGLTATIFSVVNGAFFKSLPFEEADRIVSLWGTDTSQASSFSYIARVVKINRKNVNSGPCKLRIANCALENST